MPYLQVCHAEKTKTLQLIFLFEPFTKQEPAQGINATGLPYLPTVHFRHETMKLLLK